MYSSALLLLLHFCRKNTNFTLEKQIFVHFFTLRSKKSFPYIAIYIAPQYRYHCFCRQFIVIIESFMSINCVFSPLLKN